MAADGPRQNSKICSCVRSVKSRAASTTVDSKFDASFG